MQNRIYILKVISDYTLSIWTCRQEKLGLSVAYKCFLFPWTVRLFMSSIFIFVFSVQKLGELVSENSSFQTAQKVKASGRPEPHSHRATTDRGRVWAAGPRQHVHAVCTGLTSACCSHRLVCARTGTLLHRAKSVRFRSVCVGQIHPHFSHLEYRNFWQFPVDESVLDNYKFVAFFFIVSKNLSKSITYKPDYKKRLK